MIVNFSIAPEKVIIYTTWNANLGNTSFPLISMDRCSYIVSSSIESGINFDISGNRHHVQIGKYSSIGHNLKLNIDLHHDYLRISTGEIPELKHLTGYITNRNPRNLDCAETAHVLGVPIYSGFSKPNF